MWFDTRQQTAAVQPVACFDEDYNAGLQLDVFKQGRSGGCCSSVEVENTRRGWELFETEWTSSDLAKGGKMTDVTGKVRSVDKRVQRERVGKSNHE